MARPAPPPVRFAALAAAAAVAVGCATSTPPAPEMATSVPVELVERVCDADARLLSFTKLGVPEGERPIDLALDPHHAWVLFEGGRLLRVDRALDAVEVAVLVPEGNSTWTQVASDPAGGVWVSTKPFGMRRIEPDLTIQHVPLQGVMGDGRFLALEVTEDAIYARPAVAEHAIWVFDRDGKLRAVAKPIDEPQGGPLHVGEGQRSGVGGWSLRRDENGQVVLWNRQSGIVERPLADGSWEPTGPGVFADAPRGGGDAASLGLGSDDEHWYLPASGQSDLVVLAGEPVFVGGPALGVRGHGTILYVRTPGEPFRPVVERCGGRYLRALTADDRGYAALSENELILGLH